MKINIILQYFRKTTLFPLFIFIVQYLCLAQTKISQSDKDLALHFFMQGEFLIKQGNYAAAVLELQEAIDLDPNVPTIHVSIADAYIRLGKNRRAENHLDTALELDPQETEAYEILGGLYLSQKRFIEAEIVYNELIKIAPNNIDYIFALADICRAQKKWDNAIDHYISAYKINSDVISALENALQISLAINDYKRSEEICDLLISEFPTSTKYLATLKDLALYNNKYDKALSIIEKMGEINDFDKILLLQKSAIYSELNKPTLAIHEMLNAYKMDSLDADVINELFNLFLNEGQIENAEKYNKILLKNFSNDVRGFINKALISLENKSPQTAISDLSPVINKFDKNYTINYLLGISYYQTEDYLNAENYLIKALAIFPKSRSAKHNLALIYDITKKWSKSDEIYVDLISTDSTDAQAFNNYAYSLAERDQDYELALELAKNSIRLKPDSAPYLDTIGWIYFKLKDYDNAIKYIRESLSIDSKSDVINEHFNIVVKARSEKLMKKNIQQAVVEDSTKVLSP